MKLKESQLWRTEKAQQRNPKWDLSEPVWESLSLIPRPIGCKQNVDQANLILQVSKMNTCTSIISEPVVHQIVLLRHATSSWNESEFIYYNQRLQVNVNLKFKCSLNRSIEHKCIICGINFDSLNVTLKVRRHQSIEANSFGQNQCHNNVASLPHFTYITKVFFDDVMCSLVHQVIGMVLQHLNTVQSSQLFHQQAKFLSLAQLLCSLESCVQDLSTSATTKGYSQFPHHKDVIDGIEYDQNDFGVLDLQQVDDCLQSATLHQSYHLLYSAPTGEVGHSPHCFPLSLEVTLKSGQFKVDFISKMKSSILKQGIPPNHYTKYCSDPNCCDEPSLIVTASKDPNI